VIPLLLLSGFVSGEEQDPEIAKQVRVGEIKSWSSAVGTWEGTYFVEAAPEDLLQSMADEGTDKSGIGIKAVLQEDKAAVFFKYEPDSQWTEIGQEVHLIPDNVGWHVLMANEGGVWLERYFVSFSRISEEVAEIVVTRTVHNWHVPDGEQGPVTYHVFGAGQVTRKQSLD